MSGREGPWWSTARCRGITCAVDALGLAAGLKLPPVTANLIVLGFAAGQGLLFCRVDLLEAIIREKSPARFREGNLQAFGAGCQAAAQKNQA